MSSGLKPPSTQCTTSRLQQAPAGWSCQAQSKVAVPRGSSWVTWAPVALAAEEGLGEPHAASCVCVCAWVWPKVGPPPFQLSSHFSPAALHSPMSCGLVSWCLHPERFLPSLPTRAIPQLLPLPRQWVRGTHVTASQVPKVLQGSIIPHPTWMPSFCGAWEAGGGIPRAGGWKNHRVIGHSPSPPSYPHPWGRESMW